MDKDLKSFQQDVIKEFTDLKWIRENMGNSSAESDDIQKLLGKGPVSRRFVGFARRALRSSTQRPENLRAEERAQELMLLSKVRNAICRELSQIVQVDLLDEEVHIKVIKGLTSALIQANLPCEQVIERDPKVFAHIAYCVVENSIEVYCRDGLGANE